MPDWEDYGYSVKIEQWPSPGYSGLWDSGISQCIEHYGIVG